MASVTQNKRTSESKYVSIFNDGSDGSTDVDVSFREPLLSRPSDHFLVGVDNLTVNMNNLSMIDLNNPADPDDFIFQIGRLSGATDVAEATLNAQEALGAAARNPMLTNNTSYIFPEEYKFRVTTTMQNIQQLAFYLTTHFDYVNDTFVREGVEEALVLGGRGATVNAAARKVSVLRTGAHVDLGHADNPGKHIRCDLTGDGRLRIRGSRLFWATHFIVFNRPEYMYMFSGKRRYSSTVAGGATTHYNESQYSVDLNGRAFAGTTTTDAHRFLFSKSTNGTFCSLRALPAAFTNIANTAFALDMLRPTFVATANSQTFRNTILTLILGANLMSTSDRRVAIEVGCSLPIVNNPLVDHGQESPDIVIGRWMFNPKVRIKTTVSGTEMTFEGSAPDVFEFQNATDRVQYQALMPQDKIHMLRLKMYARVRKYNPVRDRFDMETIVYPMRKNDWWHTRLHFISKD